MPRLYRYVGPRNIARRQADKPAGAAINSSVDIVHWVQQSHQEFDDSGILVVTFVVDEPGVLRIADRRSEHFACAGGRPVQSAGELAFSMQDEHVEVAWVTNQSTGYCPEPASWPAVRTALERAGIRAPSGFSQEMSFRRCRRCGAINIVKDGDFKCTICSDELPAEWNFDVRSATEPIGSTKGTN